MYPAKIKTSVYLLITLAIFLTTQGRAQVTVQIGQSFTGSSYSNTPVLPPDSNGEIGPNHFMEFINGTVAIYNKTNGLNVQRKTNLKFWSDAGLIISPDSAVSDPRVIFDPTVQRWFAVQVDFSTAVTDPSLNANDFLFAVSATSDPTGVWRGFSFQADPATGNFADFPTMGIDSNAIYLSGDFYHGETNPVGSGIVSIPKAALLSTTPTIANRTWFGILDYAVRGEILQPAICFDGSSSGNILAMGDIGSDSIPYSNVVNFVVQNGATPTATLSPSINIDVSPYLVPFNASTLTPMFNPLQPDNTRTITANDARLSGKVYAVGGVLYAVHSTDVNGRIAIRWYRINAATHALMESGTISDANLDLFFPSIAANNNGVVVIGCNGSGANTFVSSFAVVGQTVNGMTTFASPVLLKAGVTSYHGDDEFIAGLLDEPLISRWGDYSATSVDSSNPTHFWTIQMFPSDANVWSTQITEVITTLPVTAPTLTISLNKPNATVSWPATATGFNLEANTNLSNANGWILTAQNFSTNNGRITYQASLTNKATFFRLRKP